MRVYQDNGQNSLNEIQRVQDELGYFFPKTYIDLMLQHDALRPEEDCFDFINFYGKQDDRDIVFISFKDNHLNGNILKKQSNISDLNNYGVKNLIIFGRCGNGDYICFDYREDSKTSNPKVVLVYHDDFVDYEDGTSSMVVNNVANNFDDFLNLLHE